MARFLFLLIVVAAITTLYSVQAQADSTAGAEKFVGKWKLVKSEGFDEYMKEVGVNPIMRKLAVKFKPVLEFKVDRSHWKFTSFSTFKTHVTEFDLDQEIVEETLDGRKMKSVFKFDGRKLIQEQKKINPEDHDSHFERYIDANGKLVIICESGGVKCTRKFERVNYSRNVS